MDNNNNNNGDNSLINNFGIQLPNILNVDNNNNNNNNNNNSSGNKKYHQYSAKYRHSWVCTTDDGYNGGAKDQKELMTTFKYKTIKQNRVKVQPSTIDHLFPTLQCNNSLLKVTTPSKPSGNSDDDSDTDSDNSHSKKVIKTKLNYSSSVGIQNIIQSNGNGTGTGNGVNKVTYSMDSNTKKKNKNVILIEILEKKLNN